SMRGLVSRRVKALRQIDGWPVPFAAAGALTVEGRIETHGDTGRSLRLASVSKPVAALAVLVAAEEGVVDLDEPAGPPGSTVRHLLAHASGLPFQGTPADLLERRVPHAGCAPHRTSRDALWRLRSCCRVRAARDRARSIRRSGIR